MSPNVFKRIEKEINEKFPAGVDKILFRVGYDSMLSLSNLNLCDITEIENAVKNNLEYLDETEYELTEQQTDNYTFKFKPGHKNFILNLPKIIEKINKKAEEEKEKRKQNKRNTVSETNVSNAEKNNLRTKLIQKILNFVTSKGFEIAFEEESISAIERVNDKIRCTVQCPLCDTTIGCEYKKYWLIGNLQSHLKKHFEIINNQNSTTANATTVIVDNDSELDEILEDQ